MRRTRSAAALVGLGLFLGLSGFLLQCDASEDESMALTVELTVGKADLLYQENPTCRVVLTNKAGTAITAMDPAENPNCPMIRVIDVDSGAENTYQRRGDPFGGTYRPLKQNESLQHDFSLLDITGALTAGEYEVSAVCFYDNGNRTAESPARRIKIGPATPKSLSLINGTTDGSATQYGVCLVLGGADEARIGRYEFQVTNGGGVADVAAGPKVPLRILPVISVPRNKASAAAHWIAWLDGEEFCTTYLDEAGEALPVSKLKIAGLEATIVAPLFFDSSQAWGPRPNGRALLLLGSPTGSAAKFQVIRISAEGAASLGGHMTLAARPTWAKSHERTDAVRLVVFTAAGPEGLSLFASRWPGQAGAQSEPPKAITWKDTFHVGGDTAMTDQDDIVGASLVSIKPLESPELVMRRWAIDRMGKFKEDAPIEVPWPPSQKISRAIVRISTTGATAALIRNEAGAWFSFDGLGKVEPLVPPYSETKLALGLTFYGQSDPVLIAALQGSGFAVTRLDGSPLPPDPSK